MDVGHHGRHMENAVRRVMEEHKQELERVIILHH